MSQLTRLKDCKTLHDIAELLGYRPSALSFILYKIPEDSKYRTFSIPKKSGGFREIYAPNAALKAVQKQLAILLSVCLEEISKDMTFKRSLSHAFKSNHSIATNARAHTNMRYVLNLDLANFFPSLNFGRVRGFFIKDKRFLLDSKIATIIAQIACHKNQLPQGSPCSPIISELLGTILDIRLVRLAKQNGCTYTRYADDITFSTNLTEFPKGLAVKKYGTQSEWELSKKLVDKIKLCGFEINIKKTRVQYNNSRQMVTGLTVNKGINISSDYYRTTRVMCDKFFKTGEFKIRDYSMVVPQTKHGFFKRILQVFGFKSKKVEKLAVLKSETAINLNQLGGRLNHIFRIKKFSEEVKTSGNTTRIIPFGTLRMYQDFLRYQRFFANEAPLVLCEGKTDNIYLKCALRSRATAFPNLAEGKKPEVKFKIQFFNYTAHIKAVLNLGGGVSDINKLISNWASYKKKYIIQPKHPVIVLVDNDDGGKTVISAMKTKRGFTFNPAAPFHHFGDNLYIVFTPQNPKTPAETMSSIEDFFEDTLLAETLDGRKFNRSNTDVTQTEYTKFQFAEQIVRKRQNTINFVYFDAIFSLIDTVILDYPRDCHVL